MAWVGVRAGGSGSQDPGCVEQRRSRFKTDELPHKQRAKHSQGQLRPSLTKSRTRRSQSGNAAEDAVVLTSDIDSPHQDIAWGKHEGEPAADAVERERRRIARDLHDHAGQYVVGIGLRLAALETRLSDDATRATLHEIHALVDHFSNELRTICTGDRGTAPCGRDLRSALGHMMQRWEHEVGIPVRFDWEATDPAEIDDAVSEAVFRLIQEALTNVAKHASNASRVAIRLRVGLGTLELAVTDDGASVDGTRKSGVSIQRDHYGISGMRERVLELGGRFDVRHQEQEGTRVFAAFPLRASNAPTEAVLP